MFIGLSMPGREDWVVAGLLIGAVAFLGVVVYLSRKKAGQRIALKKIGEKRIVLRNLERVEMVRDREGNLKEMIIHREVSQ